MHLKITILVLTALLAAACQPQVIYVVLSPTPTTETTDVTAVATEATPEVTPPATESAGAEATTEATAVAQVATTIPIATLEVTPLDLAAGGTVPPTETPAPLTPSVTPPPTAYPTPVFQQIQVAEQLFEHGRMFWLQPIDQIWVLVVTGEGHGTWTVYDNTHVEGEPESDPNIVPPEGLLQPVRGFGKLWREVAQVRNQLGWAVTPEFGYVSRYEFHAGGTVGANNVFTPVPGTGYHILFSLYGEQFRFNEADSTWQLGG
jgi:hypothetical protein